MNETMTLCLEIIFWLALFVVFYTYLGYGIVLYILVKLKELFVKPVKRSALGSSVSSAASCLGSYPLHYGIQRRRCSGREDGKQS